MTRKICISGYYGFDNFGDETILKILVENLKKSDCEITVLSVNPKKTSEKLNVKSAQTFNLKDVVVSIYQSNCLISGGGSLLQDATSVKSLIYYLVVIFIAKLFNKKVIIFAQGIGPISNKLLKKITMFLLKKADYITVRDEKSLKLLRDNSIIKAQKCADPVWNIEVQKKENTGKIGVQLRDFSITDDIFIKKLAENINKYYSDKEIVILSLQNKLDTNACNKLYNTLKQINSEIKAQVVENTSNDKVIDDICSLDVLIGMRFHACLIAIKAGVKLLPINYDVKVETLAKDFDLNYINNSFDITDKFEKFVNKEIIYNPDKINEKNFDFETLKKFIYN